MLKSKTTNAVRIEQFLDGVVIYGYNLWNTPCYYARPLIVPVSPLKSMSQTIVCSKCTNGVKVEGRKDHVL